MQGDADGLVAWLTDVLNTLEQLALDVDDDERVWETDRDDVWAVGVDRTDQVVPIASSLSAVDHVAKNDPRAVLARVEAERAIVALWSKDWDSELASRLAGVGMNHVLLEQLAVGSVRSVLLPILKSLAYGHRFDAPGYRDEWKPADV